MSKAIITILEEDDGTINIKTDFCEDRPNPDSPAHQAAAVARKAAIAYLRGEDGEQGK